jgi:hypothetical protein
MTEMGDKHERTLAFAEIALRQIKALRQPAEPRDYEIWYSYATGYNPNLNKAINVRSRARAICPSLKYKPFTTPISGPLGGVSGSSPWGRRWPTRSIRSWP